MGRESKTNTNGMMMKHRPVPTRLARCNDAALSIRVPPPTDIAARVREFCWAILNGLRDACRPLRRHASRSADPRPRVALDQMASGHPHLVKLTVAAVPRICLIFRYFCRAPATLLQGVFATSRTESLASAFDFASGRRRSNGRSIASERPQRRICTTGKMPNAS